MPFEGGGREVVVVLPRDRDRMVFAPFAPFAGQAWLTQLLLGICALTKDRGAFAMAAPTRRTLS